MNDIHLHQYHNSNYSFDCRYKKDNRPRWIKVLHKYASVCAGVIGVSVTFIPLVFLLYGSFYSKLFFFTWLPMFCFIVLFVALTEKDEEEKE